MAAHELRIAQHDLRSVRVELGGTRFLLRYGFSFDSNERLPESVALSGSEVTAFFLSSTVRDRIVPTSCGFTVERRWSVLQAGRARLALTIDVPETPEGPRTKGGRPPKPRSFRFLFPGVWADSRVGQAMMFRGERTAIPACVAVACEELGVCAFAEPGAEAVSVGIEHATDDSGGLVRLRFETPPREERPDSARSVSAAFDPGEGTEEEAASAGDLERAMKVQVVTGEPGKAYETALGLALKHYGAAEGTTPGKWAVREEIRAFLGTHLVAQGGICGLRVVPGSDLLSASAASELAALLGTLYPQDGEMVERALRLADFALRGQHPAGFFYERYSIKERSWVGLRGTPPGRVDRPPLLSVEESARIASSLFDLADALAAMGRDGGRYVLSARRMVDAFFDARGKLSAPGAVMTPDGSTTAERGLAELRFLHPVLRMADRDSRERYRKAAIQLVARWLEEVPPPLELPASRSGRGPDAKGALLLLEAALEAMDRRIKLKPAASLPSLLLPWIYLGDGPGRGPMPGAGSVVDSLDRPRWKPRAAQICYLSSRYAAVCKGPARKLLGELAREAARAAGALPLGCSFVARSAWEGIEEAGAVRFRSRRRARPEPYPGFAVGQVDARDFVTELGYCVRLDREKLW